MAETERNFAPETAVYLDKPQANQTALEQILEDLSAHNSAVYHEKMEMWELDGTLLNQYPELSAVRLYSPQEAESVFVKRAVAHTKERVQQEQDKVYLDFVPPKMWEFLKDPAVKYDSQLKKYYLSGDDALRPEFAKLVTKCRFKRAIKPGDFGGGQELTPGKLGVIHALNTSNPADRNLALADALALCAKESVLGVPGAVKSFSEILQVDKLHGRTFGFKEAFCLAKQWYQAVNANKNQQLLGTLDEKITAVMGGIKDGPDAMAHRMRLADKKAHEVLGIQAAKLCRVPLAKRLAYAAQNKDPKQALALAGQVFQDFLKGQERLTRLYAGMYKTPFSAFKEDAFVKEVDAALKGVMNLNDQRQYELYQKITQQSALCAAACRRLDQNMQLCINARAGRAPAEVKTVLQQSAAELDGLQEAFKRSGLYETVAEYQPQAQQQFLNAAKEPLYIAASYEDRRELHAQYPDKLFIDPVHGALCVEDTPENRQLFARFIPQPGVVPEVPRSYEELKQQAAQAMAKYGYSVPYEQIDMSGHWKTDPKDKSKAYIINVTGGVPRMQLFDHNGSLNEKILLGQPSPEQKEQIKKALEQHKLNNDLLKYQAQQQAAQAARSVLEQLPAANLQADNAYFAKKGLSLTDVGYGLADPSGQALQRLFDPQHKHEPEFFRDQIAFPLVNTAGKIMSAQMIAPDGSKSFLKGAPMSGNFVPIGGMERLQQADTVLIAEGIATAATISKLAPPGTAVLAAVAANNLAAVTQAVSRAFPDKAMALMADNDLMTAGVNRPNPGFEAAMHAAKAVENERPGLPVVVPPLTAKQMVMDLTDFNDCYQVNPAGTKERVEQAVAKARRLQQENQLVKEQAQKLSAQRPARQHSSALPPGQKRAYHR